jgi:hypothetical protein
MVFGRKTLDKKIRMKYPARGVPVPAPQALLNLIATVFGEPGTPLSFFSHVAGLAKKREGVRVIVSKVFGDSTYMTALETRYFLTWGFRIRHHVVPACNDFLSVNGDLLLDRAYSWASPVVIVDQYPTKMLWARYEPVYRLMEKPLKYKASKSSASAYLPGVTLVDAVYRAIPKAEYPVMLSVCSERDKKIQECTREGLLIVMDEYVSTLVYAVNMGVLIPEAREAVKATVETPELEIKVGKGDKQ